MAGNLKLDVLQIGDNATATNNLFLKSHLDGSFSFNRGNFPTSLSELLKFDASGNTSLNNLSSSGDLTLSGVGKRIKGDFSNATTTNRLMFQTSTVNGASYIGNIPNGTGTAASIYSMNSSDANNASYLSSHISSTEAVIISSVSGTGTQLPLRLRVGSTTRLSIDTAGTNSYFYGTTNCIVEATATNGYAGFNAIGSGTNNSYVFFSNGSGERARLSTDNTGTISICTNTASIGTPTHTLTFNENGAEIHLRSSDSSVDVLIDNMNRTARFLCTSSTGDLHLGLTHASSAGGVRIYTKNTERSRITDTGFVSLYGITSNNPTSGVGYETGAGGSVTQTTSYSTAVTLNTITGTITTVAGPTTGKFTFDFNNSTIGANDILLVELKMGIGANNAKVWSTLTAGGVGTGVRAIHIELVSTFLSLPWTIRFAVIKSTIT